MSRVRVPLEIPACEGKAHSTSLCVKRRLCEHGSMTPHGWVDGERCGGGGQGTVGGDVAHVMRGVHATTRCVASSALFLPLSFSQVMASAAPFLSHTHTKRLRGSFRLVTVVVVLVQKHPLSLSLSLSLTEEEAWTRAALSKNATRDTLGPGYTGTLATLQPSFGAIQGYLAYQETPIPLGTR